MELLSVVNQCQNSLPAHMRKAPWNFTDHGRKVLQTQDELNAYIAAYGEMHIVKCRAALQNFPFQDLYSYAYEIFDWGCGQGLASLTLLEMLEERGKLASLKRISLVEPSRMALNRARQWVEQYAPGIEVVEVNKPIPASPEASMDEVYCGSMISINLFSNILDIRSLSLSWLAAKVASLAKVNYMVCVGPKFVSDSNTRIADFCGYFNPESYFSEISRYPYGYTSQTFHPYGCEARCFVHNRDEVMNLQYQECASSESCPDPYDYSLEVLDGIVSNKVVRFYYKLRQACGTAYDVFFNPQINCDTADFVLASLSHGIVLVNVCERLEDLESAYYRINFVKNNLFALHLKSLKINSILAPSVYNCVKTALYFPGYSDEEVEEAIKKISESGNESKNKKAIGSYLLRFTDSTDLKQKLDGISSRGFKSEYYEELEHSINASWHSYKQGDLSFRLLEDQKKVVRDTKPKLKLKGAAGCGKTQIVAYKAVEEHLKTGDRVLIITFNITLIQYIKMRIMQVPADFSPNMFEIINYHQFFISKAKQYSSKGITLEAFDDPEFFEDCKDLIRKYKTIIIDEVQDFKTEWLQSIVHYFLEENGSITLLGDGDQNIYERKLDAENKMPMLDKCGFPRGKWVDISLSERDAKKRQSLRVHNPRLVEMSSLFAKSFMNQAADLVIQNEADFENYHLRYWNVGAGKSAKELASNIYWIVTEFGLDVKDVTVLGENVKILRDIEVEYSQATGQKTMISFETEDQYRAVMQGGTYSYKDLDELRRAAKTHFTTCCDAIKMSTIHSFKGWESDTIILILQPEHAQDENYEGYSVFERENSPALIYTALTRAKKNLFILNLNNTTYHPFFNNYLQ